MKSLVRMHPRILFLYFVCILGITMFLWHPWVAVLSFTAALLWRHFLKMKTTPAGALGIIAAILILTLLNPLISHEGETVLFYMNRQRITWEALVYGFLAAVMLVNTLLWCGIFSRVMTADRLLFVFGKGFSKTGMLVTLVFRFIPLFRRQWEKIREGQNALFGRPGDGFREAFLRTKQELLVMTTWSLEHGMITADAMTARGYGSSKRSFFQKYEWHLRESILLAVILIGLSGVILLCSLGYLHCTVYPTVSITWSRGGDVLAALCFAVLLLMPLGNRQR